MVLFEGRMKETVLFKGRRKEMFLFKGRRKEMVLFKGRKEMFLFKDALNTFYLRLYGIRHMEMDHSVRGRKEGNVFI